MTTKLQSLEQLQSMASWRDLLYYGSHVLMLEQREDDLYGNLSNRDDYFSKNPEYLYLENKTPADIYFDMPEDEDGEVNHYYERFMKFKYRNQAGYHRYNPDLIDEHLDQHAAEFNRIREYYTHVYVPERERRLASVSFYDLLLRLSWRREEHFESMEIAEAIQAKRRFYNEHLHEYDVVRRMEWDLESWLRFYNESFEKQIFCNECLRISCYQIERDLRVARTSLARLHVERGDALFMSQHARLGAQSPLRELNSNTLDIIHHLAAADDDLPIA
jgi:hypothetical protein